MEDRVIQNLCPSHEEGVILFIPINGARRAFDFCAYAFSWDSPESTMRCFPMTLRI